jgi:acylphosphatase
MANLSEQHQQIRAHVFISGTVQGVGYRFSTMRVAKQLGVSGWMRNLPDKRVEAVFEGTQQGVDAIVRWCHGGPPGAVVKDVTVEYEQPEGIESFETRR